MPLGAACALLATVIGGALGVGDSIAANLERHARGRLCGVAAALRAERPFDASLAERLVGIGGCLPAMLVPSSVESTGSARRGAQATLLGVDDASALGVAHGAGDAILRLGADAVAINRPLADALNARFGDTVVLRVLERSPIAAEMPLGRRVRQSVGRRVKVEAILDDGGLGRFSLEQVQEATPLAVVSLATAGSLVRQPGAANVVLAVDRAADAESSRAAAESIARSLRPTLDDYGLALEIVRPGLARLSSESLVIPPEADRAAEAVLAPLGATPVMMLLANEIKEVAETAVGGEAGGTKGTVPYSTIAGIATSDLPFGRLESSDGRPMPPPASGEIVVDAWLADDLAKQGRPIAVGSKLEVTFFAPETLHGRAIERRASFLVSGIARMEGAAVERSLVPEVEGITDKRSIANWDPPFPFDASRVRSTPPHDEDDRYWNDHGATPKAFISLADARGMAGGRFGCTTTWHIGIPSDRTAAETVAGLADRVAEVIRPEAMGFDVRPVLAEGIAAARGSTPFGGLFIALSSFVVVAAVALEWLLARLLVSTRLPAVGTLAAVGWPPGRIAAVFGGIGSIAAAAGCCVGALVGPAWSAALLALLGRGFRGVEGAAKESLFAATAPRPATIVAVAIGTFLVALVAPWLAGRGVARLGVKRLLAGSEGGLRAVRRPTPVRSALGLVRRGLMLQPGRTLAVVGMVAIAEFLIVVVSSFQARPPADPRDRGSPTGGWTQMATLAEPCAIDLADREQLVALGLSPDEQETVLASELAMLRASRGEDASCLNLQKVNEPMLLGVPRTFRERGGFRFLASKALRGESPWKLLDRPMAGWTGPIPAVLDEATARYALGLSGVGDRIELPDDRGEPIALEVVGLLEPGILQGAVVVSEEDFLAIHPSAVGFQVVLAESSALPDGKRPDADLGSALKTALADFGPLIRSTTSRLESLAAVQNTYLSGFQALGTLGLLLGTAGVAAVQARAVLERAREFGLLSAVGFGPARLRRLVAGETLVMVGLGLAVGGVSALAVVLPQMASGRASLPVGWAAVSSLGTLVAAIVVGRIWMRRLAEIRPSDAMRVAE